MRRPGPLPRLPRRPPLRLPRVQAPGLAPGLAPDRAPGPGLGPVARGSLVLATAATLFPLLTLPGCSAPGATSGTVTSPPPAAPPAPGRAEGAEAGEPGSFPVGREAALALDFPELDFTPPRVESFEVEGVPVFHLEDRTFPLVDIFLQVRGGVSHVSRSEAPATSALSPLLRTGGTRALEPDSVEARLDLLAVQLAMGSGGGGTFASVNALTPNLEEAVDLLRQLLLEPRFDLEAREVWLDQEIDRIRRREEDPGSLAFAEFNRLVFGDHPVGWVFTEEEMTSESLSEARLRRLHALTHCRDNLLAGAAGDLSRDEAERVLRPLLEAFPPCPSPLPEVPLPTLREGPGIWILPRPVEQTTIIVAGPGGIRQEDTPDYFASRIAHSILGAGGFTSRLFQRVRTEAGLAYGASSVWTTPVRYEGIVGAVTATRPERTVEAVELVMEILEDFRGAPPEAEEVALAIEQAVEGAVFAFESAGQVVARAMGDRALGLPEGWFERYLEAVQEVDAAAVHAVVRRHLDPTRMVILLVGDADRFAPGLEAFGPVHRLLPDGSYEPWDDRPDPPGPP